MELSYFVQTSTIASYTALVNIRNAVLATAKKYRLPHYTQPQIRNSNTSTLSISLGSIASLEVQQWNDDLDEDNMEES